MYKTLKVGVSRERYCKKMDTRFLDEMNEKPPITLDDVKSMWYNGGDYSHRHYDDSRYHALNLHSVFNKGTIEFRLFNSTLHAGEIKSYIQALPCDKPSGIGAEIGSKSENAVRQ